MNGEEETEMAWLLAEYRKQEIAEAYSRLGTAEMAARGLTDNNHDRKMEERIHIV